MSLMRSSAKKRKENKCYSYLCNKNNLCVLYSQKCEMFYNGNKCRALVYCNEDDDCVCMTRRQDKTRQDKTRPARAETASSLSCNSETRRECESLDNKLELRQNYPQTTPSASSSSSGATNSGIESFEYVSCDDNNDSCTIGYCDNETCVHEPKCVSDDGCPRCYMQQER